MANLYDIRENIRWLQMLAEMQELTDDQELELQTLEIDRTEKLEDIVKIIRNLESDVKVYADEIKAFQKKKQRAQKNVEYLRKQLMYDLMDNEEDKKRVGHFTVGLARKPGKIVVTNEEVLPAKFKRIKQEVSKTAIKDHINDGGEIPEGVEIERGTRITIR